MDERLPLESFTAASLRSLLTQERARRQELEQEVARLRAGLARQNKIILRLERENAELRRQADELHTTVALLTEQNALLRRSLAMLKQESAQLRGVPLAPAPDPVPEFKPATPTKEPKIRKKRDRRHNHGRQRMEHANRWETHAAEECPRCGEQLAGGWIQRRVQVIDLPVLAPLEITEHRILRRQCPRCRLRVLPSSPGREAGRIGQCRFGPRLVAAIAVMANVERLPGRQIQERLRREYGLEISHGEICGLLQRMGRAAHPVYGQLKEDVRGSPYAYVDETGWREGGQHTWVWTFSTKQTLYVHHVASRKGEVVDGVLGEDYSGTLITDFYSAYDHLLTSHQRCWRHLWRDLEDLVSAHPEDVETLAWVEGIGVIWKQATADRPEAELGTTPEAARAREERARSYEQQILTLCPEDLDEGLPPATLVKRIRRYATELFSFVRDPRVDPTNNAAERSLRPLVIARKISGGTRSDTGSQTRMILYSVCATARLQGKDPSAVCQQILLAPPGASSPLAGTPQAT
jgi:transposase